MTLRAILRATAVVAVLVPAVTGCRWLSDEKGLVRNTSNDYIEAQETEPLIIPGDLSAARIRDTWPIPAIEAKPLARHYPGDAPPPDAIFGGEAQDAIKIQRLGDRRWMIIADEPSKVWPVLEQFLTENGIGIASETPEAGRIDGTWLSVDSGNHEDVVRGTIKEHKQDADGRDRIRFKIEQGIRYGTSEIHLRHENDALAQPTADWPSKSAAPDVEEALLLEFGGYYAAGISTQSVSMLARQISTANKAVIERDGQGYPKLRLNVDFDRAWAVVNSALERAEVEIDNTQRSDGLLQVNITKDVLGGRERSLLSRFWPSGEDARPLDIRIESIEESQVVQVFERDGQPAPGEISQQILVMLREFAS
ncbi:MAG: outer membrane protein assembly factor BamC [Gammaproteobacteria bacterium]|nr:outer membrane protein assembly factor BamC [Gammaproteobacteria bacterium]